MVSGSRSGDYDVAADPYCYPGTALLTNIPDIRDAAALAAFETASTAQRSDEPLPRGRLSVRHYQAIHRHLFQDVYPWAGKFREVRITKEGSTFCYPEHIPEEMQNLFAQLRDMRFLGGLSREGFIQAAARFLATLNAIHPFREGNGRTQMTFLTLLADCAGHPLDLDHLDPYRFLEAMVASFQGDERPLVKELEEMIQE